MKVRFNHFPLRKSIIGIISGVIIFFTACTENPTFLGRDLLPDSDNITIKFDSLTQIKAWTTLGRIEDTRFNSKAMVGSMRDNVFGFTRAQFMAPIQNITYRSLETGREIDSLILILAVDTTFGDAISQTVRVFEVTTDLFGDSTYYSDADPTPFYNPVELGSATFHPAIDKTIRIPITNQDFLNKFLTADDSIFVDPNDFGDVFKGLFINTDAVTGDGGSIATINIDDGSVATAMRLYFKNDTTRAVSDSLDAVYTMVFSNTYVKGNFYTHDYAGSLASSGIDNQDAQDTLLFVSGMSGLNTRLSFPGIEKWLDSTNLVINKAELIIPTDTTFINSGDFPDRLVLATVDKNGKFGLLLDELLDQSTGFDSKTKVVFNGYYNYIRQNDYVFNISFQLQSYIDGAIDNMEFVLIADKNYQSPARTILKNSGNSGIRLRIIYTDL